MPSTPIIFRAKNTEKSRPKKTQFFAPKIQKKVSLPLGGKNFGKNLWENVSGVKESPQS